MPAPAAPPEDENLWSRILSEVQSRSSASLPTGSVLVLGDNESGKTSLLARLQRKDDPKKGAGVEYHFLEVNPDLKDGSYAYQLGSALPDVGPGESTRLGVWVVDGDPEFAPLIKYSLKATAELDRCVVLLTASMQEPWNILDSLNKWAQLLEQFLIDNLERAQLNEAKDKQTRFWQEYVEPLDSSSHSGEGGAKVPSMETADIMLPLGQGVLNTNLGMSLIVVLTKCDVVADLEREYDLKEEHLDFVQMHVRNFCLKYGAACVYASAKDQRNCATLYKYVLHRVYGFPFTSPAQVVEKEAVFIPAGWDNEKKISILHEGLHHCKATDSFGTHITKPTQRRPVAAKDADVLAEDDQTFLERLKPAFNAPASQSDSRHNAQQGSESPLPSRLSRSPAQAQVTPRSQSPKKDGGVPRPAALPGVQTAENSTLAHFFNNLLTKNTPARTNNNNTAQAPTTAPVADPAGELERIHNDTQNAKTAAANGSVIKQQEQTVAE